MKVLWVCNSPISYFYKSQKLEGRGATWIESIIEKLLVSENIKLVVCFPYDASTEKIVVDDMTFCPMRIAKKGRKRTQRNVASYNHVFAEEKPDIIHIWGTEFPWVLDAVEASERMGLLDRTVLYLQGMCEAIAMHYYGGIPRSLENAYSIRDLLKLDNLKRQKRDFEKRSFFECQALKKIRWVIGRTDYDYAYATINNESVHYFVCNETLRKEFAESRWEFDECNKHQIIMSQGYYPLKGVHIVIESLQYVVKRYPDVRLIVAGPDIIRQQTWTGRIRGTGYANYLRNLIEKYGLKSNVHFIGTQSGDEMCQKYLESNLFISASSTENESNSLGEAKLLGMPVVASYVGGVGSRITHRVDGLAYQYDDPIMLANYICEMFENPEQAIALGKKARENAKSISDLERNVDTLLSIYCSICSSIRASRK